VIVLLTDATAHGYPGVGAYSGVTPTPPTYDQTIAALGGLGARIVSVSSASSGPRTDVRNMLRDFARRTGTLDASGSPNSFVEEIATDGSGLGSAVVDAIFAAAQVPLDVSARATDVDAPGESVDAVAAFINRVVTRDRAASGLTCTTGYRTTDLTGIDDDSFDDTFLDVDPGDPVCFDIIPRRNRTVPPTLDPQLFRARIDVLGDGFTPLDDREVFFLVPPRIPDPNE
jgi:hypothetical protein